MGQSPAVVLIVEDQPLLRLAAIDMVEDLGFTPLDAPDADEAVRLLESRSDIRIVFTDIDMPGSMDGMQLAALVRDRWPPVELIIVSAVKSPSKDQLPSRAVFFSKPYSRSQVAKTMRDFIKSNP